MSTAMRPQVRPKAPLLYPAGAQHRLSGGAVRGHRVPGLERDQQRRRQSDARQDRLRIRVLGRHRRFRHQSDADRIFVAVSTYGRAFWVGLLNTLLVAAIGIVLATILGFVIGIARLSSNWLVARLAGGYVELIRNLPLLLQLLFWYNAVLAALPDMRESLAVPGGGFLNNRGLFLPKPQFLDGAWPVLLAALALGVAVRRAFRIWAKQAQEATGEQAPVFWVALGLVVGFRWPLLAAAGFPIEFGYPERAGSTFAAASKCCRNSWRCCSGS
jgi:His/Glu/Gln/Arg/opine family amino acid ABC transporter permease subunit